MMKKILVLLVVLAITMISSMAFAELAVNGSVETRSWNTNNRDLTDLTGDHDTRTQTRVRLNVDGKAGDAAKARISIENDWDTWGRLEAYQADASMGTFLRLREAWMDVTLPLGGLHLRGGHQLLALGNGWFFQSMKYGSDAWVLFTDIGALHLGLVDVKVDEGFIAPGPTPPAGSAIGADDVDAYVAVASYKISDTMKAGIDITDVKKRQSGISNNDPDEMFNISANFAGKIGPVNLKAQADVQMGDNGVRPTSVDYSGMQLVAQANVALDPVVINATIGFGSGDDAATLDENEGYVNYLDANQHYATIYEYLVGQPAGFGVGTHKGFANTLAIGVGASFKVTPNLSLGADVWMLKANEAPVLADDALGMEVDLKVNWKLADNVTWNWQIAQFMADDAYGPNPDDTTAIIGVLGVTF